MPAMTVTQTILEAIERRIDQASAEITRLQAARSELLKGKANDAGKATPKPTRSGTGERRPRRRPVPAAVPAGAGPAAPRDSTSETAIEEAAPGADRMPTGASEDSSAEAKTIAEAVAPTATGPADRPAVRRRRSATRAATVVPAGKLEVLLAEADGLSTTELAERAGGSATQILTLLRELERDGKVRRSGERRTTRWHWITDEERIQARAAELERLSRSAR